MEDFLQKISKAPLCVIDRSISYSRYCPISISSDNKSLTFDVSSSSEWETYLENYLKVRTCDVAFGGYLEQRDIYNRSKHFKNMSVNTQRNIHLGIDLWCTAKTDILAVLDGEVHSFKNNTNHGDYGPTLILKHVVENVEFYSLYGHLSQKSIEDVAVGDQVNRGQVIGTLGDASINGDYAPHLHFQLIIDIQDYKGDYPGVASLSDIDFFKSNCPNPNLLLKLPYEI